MPGIDPIAAALAFADAINARDVDRLAALMTEDHEFIDSEGSGAQGRETMREGWAGYYALFPDYAISVEQSSLLDDGSVVMLGRSDGAPSDLARETLRGPTGGPLQPGDYQGPAIWTARIRDGLVAQWCVYDDTPEVRAKLGMG
jgi:hypothetical protein